MTSFKSNGLNHAEQLLTKGKFAEALLVLENIEKEGYISPQNRIQCYLLKIEIFVQLGRSEEAIKLSEQALKETQSLNNLLTTLDIVILKMGLLIFPLIFSNLTPDLQFSPSPILLKELIFDLLT
ncbi:MAG: tetratricopeptide repeat protein [Candidatus Hodarchaeota archaeon]